MKINYVAIPREIIYNKELDNKRVILFSYLCCRRALDDTVSFSVNEIVRQIGFVPNYHDGKINHKVLDLLNDLYELNYFEQSPNFLKMKSQKGKNDYFYKIKLNAKYFDSLNNGFGIIYFDELSKIINFKEIITNFNTENSDNINIDTSRLTPAHILLVLSYIRANINKSANKPRCCFRLYKTISNDIGLSERYVSRIVDILDVLNIIKYAECTRVHQYENNKSKFITTPKVFADYKKYIKDGSGNPILDINYDFNYEIKRQITILEFNSS